MAGRLTLEDANWRRTVLAVLEFAPAGLPALQGGEPGQVRKEAATAIYCECRG